MSSKPSRRQASGFSLIELMIVIAILGIIAAVAIPSYSSYVQKTRRIDATAFLIEAAGEQVRFFSENNRYASTMAEMGFGDAATADSEEGHYTVSVVSDTETSFVLTAAPVAGGLQANDTECASFTLNSSEQKNVTGTGDPRNCW